MKILRYLDPDRTTKYAAILADGATVEIAGDIVLGDWSVTDRPANVWKRLAPVAPTNLLCIGLNYRRHAAEGGAKIPQFPVLFMKPTAAVQNPGDPILLPRHLRSDEVDYEAELAVVIGRRCKNVSRDRALDYVLGYTCANDVSARDWQGPWGASQWCRGKGFDTFAPLGPWLVTRDEIPDPNRLAIRLDVDGEILQDWNTDDMIFDVPALIEFLSGSTTLLPGTVILTGTPHGVGFARRPPRWLRAGETVTVTIEGIGALSNPVEEER
ncbi:MAG: fumarylacetoacetate hydrolase family protein [Planctomycetaceae bacterium]|nr:fumarylacetoacetate hydrolase family protein [Planctomycetaceae bacterium]